MPQCYRFTVVHNNIAILLQVLELGLNNNVPLFSTFWQFAVLEKNSLTQFKVVNSPTLPRLVMLVYLEEFKGISQLHKLPFIGNTDMHIHYCLKVGQ